MITKNKDTNVGMKWEMVKLGDLVSISKGKKHIAKDNGVNRYINIENLHNPENSLYTDEKGMFVNQNDLIIAWDGANAGKVGVGFDGVIGSTLARLKITKVDVFPKYLFWNLESMNDLIKSQRTGATIPHVNGAALKDLQIPLPPLPVQKRIAEILDAADALRRKDQELIKKYDELAQAIFIDMFGDPVRNEKGWEVKKLGEVCTKIGSGATPTGGKTAYKKSGIALIRSMNVYDFSFKWKDLAYIDEQQATKLNNVEVKSKDVLFNITGASVCRCSIVPEKILPARVNQHVAIIRPRKEILNPIFLNHLLVSDRVKNNLLGVGAGGGAVMEAITKDQLENFEIIIPTIKKQNEFENKIDLVFGQKNIQNNSEEQSVHLFQSLIHKAFKGEL